MDSLASADSPRLEGLSRDHVQVLAESGTEFEPILVHRQAGRVVDGMHRLQAAILRGERDIAVRYVEGPADELFIRSVKANISHGLPLTLKDRKAAVARILASHPHWSDRAIAAVTGVSPKTVGAARERISSEESPHSNPSTARVGRDGRARPVDMSERREKVLAFLTERPDITLREVAEQTGVSISTVHRMRQGLQSFPAVPLAAGQTSAPATASPQENALTATSGTVAAAHQGAHLASVPIPPDQLSLETDRARVRAMHTLANDPSIRFTDSGRALLRWLNGQAQGLAAGERLLAALPPHCMRAVAEVANHYAREWERLAGALQQTDRLNGSWRAAR
ncbi:MULTISPECIES: winged helix-turn-helix transcriptional regulator [unclassified Streptomyces]|uniref:winged helix-turn-helix transcriptional regulator n=1 Tax=unclassified Streptomyces TaxID=2593676 RepID=UPI00236662F4|nr:MULTISPECIES: winged helix-turn-helix transcriptional regulator [unclassified Streptomyces]MDF3142788.1 winged helix-turn-helix transcriptional regulator [Streptomyces sp. T21Q-yed]WDF42865.1 winged helix-turn-helix transcriptional regulator [Streptomyces sp. T12]